VTPVVTLYTRAGCHLCERVAGLIEQAREQVKFVVEVRDIDAEPRLKALYDWEVPVVAINGKNLFGHQMELSAFVKRIQEVS
jgi:glutaredoxin